MTSSFVEMPDKLNDFIIKKCRTLTVQKWAIKVGFRTIFDGFQTLYTKTN